MIRRPPRSTLDRSSAASDVYKRQVYVYSYLYVLANPYPPFHGDQRSYTIDLQVEGPDDQGRLVTAFRLVLVIPAFVLGWVLSQVLQVIALLAWVIAIFLGRTPRGME